MSQNGESLWHFFEAKPLSDREAGTLWQGKTLSQVSHQLQGKVPSPFWLSARQVIDQALHQVLNVPLSDVLARGWNQYWALIEYRDRKKHPADEIALVPLKEHTITSSHKPQIEILVNGRSIGSLDFDVELALEIEMAILKIQDGKIWEIEMGSCRGRGTIMFGPAVLFERPTKKVQLPRVFSFAKGLTI